MFDTTLRDGQQCPGAGMTKEQNIEYALLAADLGVDTLEAGFPSASKRDFEIVHTIAEVLSQKERVPEIAALCQLRDEQIDKTMEALLPALSKQKALLHVYLPVSPELMKASLGDKADKHALVRDTATFISRASRHGYIVEFSPEGYSRQKENFNFVTDVILAAVESGAQIINCPDTIGSGFAAQGEDYFVNLMNRHANIVREKFPKKNVIWSTHCHNDYGLAVQNSLNAVLYGPATQIEGCINGIGERAGNAALESVVMIIDQYGALDALPKQYTTQIDIQKLQDISDFVKNHMLPRQPHWPITGDNASKHSSGGHTNAVLTDPLAYQPFDPRRIGNKISLVFGPLSGGNHAQSIIRERGYVCEDKEKAQIAQYVKNIYSDRRKGITDDELMLGYFSYRSPIQVNSFDYARTSSQVTLKLEGKLFDRQGKIEEHYIGKDSALAALKRLIDPYFPCSIVSHRSESDREGIEAESISKIVISCNQLESSEVIKQFEGEGRDSDIEISALKALLDAVNKAYIYFTYKKNE